MAGDAESLPGTSAAGPGGRDADRRDRRGEGMATPHVKLLVEAMVFTCCLDPNSRHDGRVARIYPARTPVDTVTAERKRR